MRNAILKPLFAQKAWANKELFRSLAGVSPDRHPIALHSALRTLNHVHVVDCIFRAHLQDKPHGYQTTNTEDTPTLSELQAAVAETDAWYAHYVAKSSATQLVEVLQFSFTDGSEGRMTREEMLMHVTIHSAYHRGMVSQALKGIAITPPSDTLTKFLQLSLHETQASF
jgi:uncharacterized damage-inducible protein DinB